MFPCYNGVTVFVFAQSQSRFYFLFIGSMTGKATVGKDGFDVEIEVYFFGDGGMSEGFEIPRY